MVTGSTAGHIALWNLEEKKLQSQIRNAHYSAVSGMNCLPSEPLMVTSAADNSLKVGDWVHIVIVPQFSTDLHSHEVRHSKSNLYMFQSTRNSRNLAWVKKCFDCVFWYMRSVIGENCLLWWWLFRYGSLIYLMEEAVYYDNDLVIAPRLMSYITMETTAKMF